MGVNKAKVLPEPTNAIIKGTQKAACLQKVFAAPRNDVIAAYNKKLSDLKEKNQKNKPIDMKTECNGDEKLITKTTTLVEAACPAAGRVTLQLQIINQIVMLICDHINKW